MLEDSQNQSKPLNLLSKHVSCIMLIYFSQTFPAMLFRLVGTADTAGVLVKKKGDVVTKKVAKRIYIYIYIPVS